MDFGKGSEEGHGITTCDDKRGALAAQEDALTTATYGGRELRLNGEVLGPEDERRELVTNILFLPGVTAIHEDLSSWPPKGAFYGCTSLTSVLLPEGLTSIGGYAFAGCTSLASINLPVRLTAIGGYAFAGCTSLSSVILPEGLTVIEFGAFDGCTSLSSVTLPVGLTTIGRAAFGGCTSLSSVTLPERLVTIGQQAFSGCTILEQRSLAAGHPNVVSYLRFLFRVSSRYAVLASLARLRSELYARQAKRARIAYADAVQEEDEEEDEEEEVVPEEQVGVLRGALAFDIIHSDDLWRHILEFV